MKADPTGLAALAAQLTTSAATTAAAIPAGVPHPPLAPDSVSTGAAERLTTAGVVLAGSTSSHVADLGELAARMATIAAAFGAREAENATAQATLTPTRGDSQQLPPPLVRPPVAPDIRPPLVPGPLPSGEVAATQAEAGSANTGTGFTAGWKDAASALRSSASDLRAAASWLPEVWRTTAPGAQLASVFTTRAATLDGLADRADNLSQQGTVHAQSFDTYQRTVPSTNEFATNRQNLQTAQLNNVRTGGAYSAQVAALTAERSRLEQRAATAHTTYAAESATGTEAYGGGDDTNGDDPTPNGSQPPPDDQPPPEEPPAGAGLDDPTLAQMLPMLLSAVVGGVGGLMGSVVPTLTSVPQQLLSAGSGLIQGATQAASGAGKFDPPEPSDIKPESMPDISGLGGGGDPGVTAPAGGGGDGLPPVSGAGPMTAPAAPLVAAAGTVPTAATSGVPSGMGGGMAPPMMPMSGTPGGGQDKDNKKQPVSIRLTHQANTEPVSGEVASDRGDEAVAAGTERVPPPAPERSTRVFRITEPES